MFFLAVAIAAPLVFTQADGALGFRANATLGLVEGRARTFAGSFDPATLSGDLTLPASELTTDLGPRDSRMHGTVLEVTRFPSIVFLVGGVEGDADGLQSGTGSGDIRLVGALTIRDVTRVVRVPAAYTWEGDHLRLAGDIPLVWSEWGVPDPSVLVSTLAPVVQVRFNVLAHPPGSLGAQDAAAAEPAPPR